MKDVLEKLQPRMLFDQNITPHFKNAIFLNDRCITDILTGETNMEKNEFAKLLIEFYRVLVSNGYSQDMLEQAGLSLLIVPPEVLPETVQEFTRIAEKKLPEVDFHWEISQVINRIMGYH